MACIAGGHDHNMRCPMEAAGKGPVTYRAHSERLHRIGRFDTVIGLPVLESPGGFDIACQIVVGSRFTDGAQRTPYID